MTTKCRKADSVSTSTTHSLSNNSQASLWLEYWVHFNSGFHFKILRMRVLYFNLNPFKT